MHGALDNSASANAEIIKTTNRAVKLSSYYILMVKIQPMDDGNYKLKEI